MKPLFCVMLCVCLLSYGHQFMSLRHERTNVRYGPETTFPLKFTWNGPTLPVEVLDQKGLWTLVQDYEGERGWVQSRMLSKKNTVICQKDTELRAEKGQHGHVVAFLKKGVVALLLKQDDFYCYVQLLGDHKRLKGWAPQKHLWGVA